MNLRTDDDLASPVTVDELMAYMNADDEHPSMSGILIAVTDLIEGYIGRGILMRRWVVEYDTAPFNGTASTRWLSRAVGEFQFAIPLPYASIISVIEVTADGETIAAEDYRVGDDYIYLNTTALPLVIEYEAGISSCVERVPESIKNAILAAASYLFAHRGSCAMPELITASGAGAFLQRFRKPELLI